jgi:hypothetical protein
MLDVLMVHVTESHRDELVEAPIASSAEQRNICSAAALKRMTHCSESTVMIASMADAIIPSICA